MVYIYTADTADRVSQKPRTRILTSYRWAACTVGIDELKDELCSDGDAHKYELDVNSDATMGSV